MALLPLLIYDAEDNIIGERVFFIALLMGVIGFVSFQFMIRNTVIRAEGTDKISVEQPKFNVIKAMGNFLKNRPAVGDLDLSAPMEFPEGKYSIKGIMEELSRYPEAFEVIAKAMKLATNFTISPGNGMWDMMKKMSLYSMADLAGNMMPKGFLESINAQLIKIDKA